MINVSKTFLPSLEEYNAYLKRIWDNGWVTNGAPLVKELTAKLCSYFNSPYLELVANGTMALQLAIKVLGLKGEIITTPYSYIATATAIIWEGCEPIFADIEDQTFCINPDLIESVITERTSAILATHIYGHVCDIDKIQRLADKYNLKVIYDAAHGFGTKINGRQVACHGDISALSFHATKLFHSAEGGAVVCKNEALAKRIGLIKKFGHIGEEDYLELGINAKMSELHAAMGLCVLPKVDEIIANQRGLSEYYDLLLKNYGLNRPRLVKNVTHNYSYYPVLFESHESMMRVRQSLINHGIMPRRYFYPSLNTLPYLRCGIKKSCPISEDVAGRVLCMPLYFGLAQDDVKRICQLVIEAI